MFSPKYADFFLFFPIIEKTAISDSYKNKNNILK